MNTVEVRKMLNDSAEDGEYKIPFLVVCDGLPVEMTAYADLVLPDTSYLERHDCMSMLDRPISELTGRSIRCAIRCCRRTGANAGRSEVLVELASRLKFPGLSSHRGARKYL